jgi:hypothetical protein
MGHEDLPRALLPVIVGVAAEISAVHVQANRRRDVVLGRDAVLKPVHLNWRWNLVEVLQGAQVRCKQAVGQSGEQ